MKMYTVYDQNGNSIEIIRAENGRYEVVGDSVTEIGKPLYNATELAFEEWDWDVHDVSANEEMMQAGKSDALVFEDVQLGTKEIFAPSLKAVREAMKKVVIGAYCIGDE